MKVHNIWIDKEISALGGEYFISLSGIVEQIKKAKESGADTLNLIINSPGGEVFEGFAIYNQLKASGLTIHAVNTGLCASIATLIFCSASKRMSYKAAQFMFHNPSGGAMGDAQQLESTAEAMRQMEETLIFEYEAVTGQKPEAIRDMMAKETWMTPDQAKAFGFLTEIVERVAAYGRVNPNKSQKMSFKAKFEKAIADFKNEVADILGSGTPKAFSEQLADESGWLYGDGDLATGKVAYMDEAMTMPAPAGEHKIKAGKTVVTDETGNITEVRDESADTATDSAEITALRAQLADLKAQLTASEARATAAEADKTTAVAKIQTAFTNLQRQIKSADVSVQADDVDPDKKGNKKANPLDAFAASINNKINRIK